MRSGVLDNGLVKTAVVGAGAIGSLFGGLLVEAGGEVWLVDVWREHIDAINDHGLCIEREGPVRTLRVRATTDPSDVGQAELVMVLVKSIHTADAAETAAALCAPSSILLTLQNGLGNAEILEQAADEAPVLAGTTSHGVTMLGPGHIRHAGVGPTVIGSWSDGGHAAAEKVSAFLTASGIGTSADENIRAVLWDKLFVTVGINAITALTGIRSGRLLESASARELVVAAVEEAAMVARSAGIQVREDPVGHVFDVIRATANNRSSMGQDVDNKRRTEIGAINGAVVREAAELGIEVPVNATLTALIETVERNY
jgi:2-dehydropantoate 2-reductase